MTLVKSNCCKCIYKTDEINVIQIINKCKRHQLATNQTIMNLVAIDCQLAQTNAGVSKEDILLGISKFKQLLLEGQQNILESSS